MVRSAPKICFSAILHRPAVQGEPVTWTFLRLPLDASLPLPSRSMTSVEGTFNGAPFQATLEPDGEGGHWLKVEESLRESSGANIGDLISLEISPMAKEPEPAVPLDLQNALAENPKASATWDATTAIARRDWIAWITSGKKVETRGIRIGNAMDMLSKGKKRVCCFDRSGLASKGFSAPIADPLTSEKESANH